MQTQIYFSPKEEPPLEKQKLFVELAQFKKRVEQSEKFGIWGGLSERERRRIKRQRAAEFDVRDVG